MLQNLVCSLPRQWTCVWIEFDQSDQMFVLFDCAALAVTHLFLISAAHVISLKGCADVISPKTRTTKDKMASIVIW